MIPVGTVCYIVGNSRFAGRCCTVTGPMSIFPQDDDGRPGPHIGYPIDIEDDDHWYGEVERNLIPITPPGLTKDEDKRIKEPA